MMMDTAITTTINTTPPVTTDATITIMESGIAELAIVVTFSSKTQACKRCSKKMKALIYEYTMATQYMEDKKSSKIDTCYHILLRHVMRSGAEEKSKILCGHNKH